MASSRKSRSECKHCRTGEEVFRYMQRRYVFDIDTARALVDDGREAVEVEPADVRYAVETSRIYEEHLAHVNTKYPGIIAYVHYITEEGELVTAHLLIDGHHRAARCLQLGKPFFAYVLTEEESLDILHRSPCADEVRERLLAACTA